MDVALLVVVLALLIAGVPVAFALAGGALLFAFAGWAIGTFDFVLLNALPGRVLAVAESRTLVAIPLFILMGTLLERSRVAADLVGAVAWSLRGAPGGLPVAVMLVGFVLAAATGVVGASVVALGLIALPPMLRADVPAARATGSVAAAGTLGQIVPPSIVLIVLADRMQAAYAEAQSAGGGFASDTVTVADLFAGALVPALVLVGAYTLFLMVAGRRTVVPVERPERPLRSLVGPLALVALVLGSILTGWATTGEAAAVGAVGAMLLASLQGTTAFSEVLRQAVREAGLLTGVIFAIVIAATVFALVFRGLGGDETVRAAVAAMPGGVAGAVFFTMALIFLLGFVLEFLEISFVVVPLVAPVLLAMEGVSPVWLGVLIALNLQTSFLTPPFGVSLFYLRSVMPADVPTAALYRGVVPFVLIQLAVLALVAFVPGLATALPEWINAPR